MRQYYILYLILLSLSINFLQAQNDTAFWFVAPDISDDKRGLDKPVYLRISTLDKPANIIIEQPANSSFSAIRTNIPANSLKTIDLTSKINFIENQPANKILNYGLHITADEKINCYYEVSGANKNPDIFVLKGSNALGLGFYIPSQFKWDNNASYNPSPTSSFDIVATEDNTKVTIMPNNDIEGHKSGIDFTITLNKGQTYSAKAISNLGAKHLMGSWIVADKKVAVTIKDDLVNVTEKCSDLMGDQLIPISKIGMEYIVVKGHLGYRGEKLYVTATKDNTIIYLNNSTKKFAIINEGESIGLTLNNEYTYMRASKPVYALHMTGNGCECAQAVLPPIRSTGSKKVSFVRSTDEFFRLSILIKNGHQNNFKLNGFPYKNLSFNSVLGTSNEWLYASLSPDLKINVVYTLENTSSSFHLGVLNGANIGTGCRYGYFSDYKKAQIVIQNREQESQAEMLD